MSGRMSVWQIPHILLTALIKSKWLMEHQVLSKTLLQSYIYNEL